MPPPSDLCAWLRSRSNGLPLALGTGMQAPLTGLRQEALAKPGSYTHASASMPGFVIPLPVSVSTGRGRGRGRGQGFCTGHHGTSTYSWAGRGRSEHFQMGHCQGLSRLFSSKAARSCLYNRASTSVRGRAGSLHFIHQQAPPGAPQAHPYPLYSEPHLPVAVGRH